MRIGLDARYIYDHFPGIGRYVYNLVAALGELEHGHTLVVCYDPALPNSRYDLDRLRRFANIELLPINAPPFSLREQVQVPLMARQQRLDLLHSTYFIKPVVGLPCPNVLTVYDLIGRRFPRLLPLRARLLFSVAMRLALSTSQQVITNSKSASDDLRLYYRLRRDRITVTPLGVDRRFNPQPPTAIDAVRAKYNLPARYVLYLGANKPHKNLERLIRAWERLLELSLDVRLGAVQLVVAGHYDPRYPEAQQLVQEKGLHAKVRFMPNVAEADLPALYSGAEVFAFPSYYEGFGLPPLEAMACGTPVLCAYASSLPEVVGDAAITIDPFNTIEMAQELKRLTSNPGLRAQLRHAGLLRARQFSWRRTALETLAVYERAVKTV